MLKLTIMLVEIVFLSVLQITLILKTRKQLMKNKTVETATKFFSITFGTIAIDPFICCCLTHKLPILIIILTSIAFIQTILSYKLKCHNSWIYALTIICIILIWIIGINAIS